MPMKCVTIGLVFLLVQVAIENAQANNPNEGSVAYTTTRGEVFSCKTIDGKTDYTSCRSAREPSNDKHEYRRWCEQGQPKEALIYHSDLGDFECLVDRSRCTAQEAQANLKFCVNYGAYAKAGQHPKDERCFKKR